jgi:hypothetical protein
MARRGNTTEAPTQEQVPTPEVEDTNTEAEGTEPEAPKTEPEVDLTDFQSAVATAFEHDGRDTTTGELPVAAIEPVNVEYRKLDGTKAKNKAKTWLENQMKAALMGEGEYDSPNLPDARSFVQIKDGLTAAKSGGSAEKAPADPAAAWVNRQASLTLATMIVGADKPEVEGDRDLAAEAQSLADSLTEQVNAYRAWAANEAEDKGDAPEVSAVVKSAIKLSTGKAAGRTGGGSSGGVRRDVGKHIASAFAGVESGTFLSVAAIAKHKSEEYGDDHPSQGAVQARLFPSSGKCTVEGVVPQDRTDDSPRGAVKA